MKKIIKICARSASQEYGCFCHSSNVRIADAAAAYYNPPDVKSGQNKRRKKSCFKYLSYYCKRNANFGFLNPSQNEPVYVRKGLTKEMKDKPSTAIAACVKAYPNQINNMQELLLLKANGNGL